MSMLFSGPLCDAPAFETEENMARVFAFLSTAPASSGKAAPGNGELSS